MADKIYTRVSPGFDADNFKGVIVAAEALDDTYGFTELGYDQVDYEVAPTVIEVTSRATRYASRDDVEEAASKVGIRLWMNEDEYLAEWPGATKEQFEENTYPLHDVTEPNELLSNPEIARKLEEAGFDAFRDFIVVSNTQPIVYCFWKPGTFAASAPVELVSLDVDDPYSVQLADEPSRSFGA